MIQKILTASHANINVLYVNNIHTIVYNAKETEVKEMVHYLFLIALALTENLMIL